uniref:Syntaxin 17 n=1 Tax=Equus caballus TaxID=9796 RepID=A0A9L0R4U3_HORSE
GAGVARGRGVPRDAGRQVGSASAVGLLLAPRWGGFVLEEVFAAGPGRRLTRLACGLPGSGGGKVSCGPPARDALGASVGRVAGVSVPRRARASLPWLGRSVWVAQVFLYEWRRQLLQVEVTQHFFRMSEDEEKVKLRRLEPAIQKFIKIVIPTDLERLRKHQINIEKQ